MRLLPFRISMGDQGARFAQPKAALPEQPLALTPTQANLAVSLDPGTQGFPVPQCPRQADFARCAAQHRIYLLQLRLVQTSGPSGPLPPSVPT